MRRRPVAAVGHMTELMEHPSGHPASVNQLERYHQLVEMAPDGILIHDGERVLLANSAAARLAGATRLDQLLGLPIETLLKPPYLKGVQRRLTAPGELAAFVPPVRETLHRLDGSELEVEVTAIAFVAGRRTSAHLVIRDITERLAVEEAARVLDTQMQEAQKMEAVGALAGGVAHEVNNMMSVVLGCGAFLLQSDTLAADLTPDVREIVAAAERASTVTRQLLAFSRRAFYKPEAFDAAGAVRQLEPVIRRLLGAGRKLVISVEHSPRIWADRGQFEQVLVNLALNARDAMPSGGTLTITTGAADITKGTRGYAGAELVPGRYATVAVTDTGTGMDSETQLRIFEPFFTTKPIGQGTGLGLAAVYGILEQNGGHVRLRSAPGEGTTFTLHMPIAADSAPGKVPARPAATAMPRASEGVTILLVEDEPIVRAIAARSLRGDGFVVYEASNGNAALEMVHRDGPPQVVLTDLMMPGMGGGELARRLKEHWPDLLVLFMSGYSPEDLQRQGMAISQGAAVIQKPFTPASLVESVKSALAEART